MAENDASENNKAIAPAVTGQIIVSKQMRAFRGATAHITLEDVSRADGEAVVIAETVITNLNHNSEAEVERTRERADTVIEFAIYPSVDSASINPKNDYAVRVWIDLKSDGKEDPNDLYSDQAYRVITHGAGNTTIISLGSG